MYEHLQHGRNSHTDRAEGSVRIKWVTRYQQNSPIMTFSLGDVSACSGDV
jgi:hypothetical protein